MRFVRWSFAAAAVYGLVATLAIYAVTPLSAATLPLWWFAGAAAATQLAYLLIATDPARYRRIIPVGIASKLSFAIPTLLLGAGTALPQATQVFAAIDAALALLFAGCFVAIGRRSPRG